MTQDEYKRLLLNIVERINQIEIDQQYLQIALEQLENPTKVTNLRVEILVSTYLARVDDALENLKLDSRKLKKGYTTYLVDDLSTKP